MRIKKYKGNEYAFSESGFWIRNPYSKGSVYDLNNLSKPDSDTLLDNELQNISQRYSVLSNNFNKNDNFIIVSNGLNFEENKKIISNKPKNTSFIFTNQSLKMWDQEKDPDYFVVNNPWSESLAYLPKRNTNTTCLFSSKTCPQFIKKYKGEKQMFYSPEEEYYSSPNLKKAWRLSDYRNSICASIEIALKMNAKKILLLDCDDSFQENMPNSVEVFDNVYCYKQQLIVKSIIDIIGYWINAEQVCEIFNDSNIGKYEYIRDKSLQEFIDE